MEPLRPQHWLHVYRTKYPDAWKQMMQYRELRGSCGIYDWPDTCFVPGFFASKIVGKGRGIRNWEETQDVPIVSILAAWRLGKGFYRFDPDLFGSVWNTPLTGNIPVNDLRHLPEWCCYVGLPHDCFSELTPYCEGFFVCMDWSHSDQVDSLMFALDDGVNLINLAIALRGDNFDECLDFTRHKFTIEMERLGVQKPLGNEKTARASILILNKLLAITLYLCTQDADLRGATGRHRPEKPLDFRGKGKRPFAVAEQPAIWEVGYRMGAALRAAYEKAETERATGERNGTSVTPHIRRAHWHTFLAGPMSASERERRVRWLPPIPVNFDAVDLDKLPAVIHKVK